MKRIFYLVLIVMMVTSCAPYTFSKLKPNDYEKYIEYISATESSTGSRAFDYSPLAYNVIKGENSLAEYDYTIVRIKSYWFTYYSGDPKLLIDTKFHDADIILAFNNYFYIGKKKSKSN